MHDGPVALDVVRLRGFVDQNVVGSRGGAGADAEHGVKGGMPCAAPIEAGQGSAMCAAIGPTVIALCLTPGRSW